MKKLLYIGVPLFLIITGSIVFYLGINNSERNPAVKGTGAPPQVEAVGEATSPMAVDAVKDAHEILNGFVGWGGSKNFSFSSNANKFETLYKYIDLAILHAPEKSLETDLENALNALKKAQQHKDVQGLLVAHRILHDLDGYLNKDPLDGKVWGYTETVSGNARKALKYIQ
ncbi:hypothetical protein [Lederbergia citrea]|uniref:Uncharacterized protein n=1 Tax=Lederbergia citrea TaxID=2833581 RepID=A0A942ULK3_9BACI|nr:hypothetical protein [Lederbergia citrea]MBS4204259.1 hypothetical protein [Lederbergia citrea]MBS4221156.1 hypothetical protein [Lederbergia citrea]